MTTITLNTDNPRLLKALQAIMDLFDTSYTIKDEPEKVKFTKEEFDKKLEKSSKSGVAYEFTTAEDFLNYVDNL
jgi:hypothetical protein